MEEEAPCDQDRGLLLHLVHKQVRIGCNNIMCLHGEVVKDAQVRASMVEMAPTIHLHWQFQNPKGTALICAWGSMMDNTSDFVSCKLFSTSAANTRAMAEKIWSDRWQSLLRPGIRSQTSQNSTGITAVEWLALETRSPSISCPKTACRKLIAGSPDLKVSKLRMRWA